MIFSICTVVFLGVSNDGAYISFLICLLHAKAECSDLRMQAYDSVAGLSRSCGDVI